MGKRSSIAALLVIATLLQLGAALAGNRGWNVEVQSKQAALERATARRAAHGGDARKQAAEMAEWWADYKEHYGKQYASAAEEARAMGNFKAFMARVDDINTNKDLPFWASGNKFADITFEDFAARYLNVREPKASNSRKLLSAASLQTIHQQAAEQGLEVLEAVGPAGIPVVRHRGLLGKPVKKPPSPKPPSPPPSPPQAPPPPPFTGVNWTAAGKVTAVRDQGGCGSCWAFAATAAIESAYLLTYGLDASTFPLDLSEQQIVSCSVNSNGCNGGGSNDAIDFVSIYNQTLEKQWPYTNLYGGATAACYDAASYAAATQPGNVIQLASSYYMPQSGSYTALQAAVTKQPVVVYVAVDSAFQMYAGGVFTSAATEINHAVVATGFATDSFWSIKNSWGTGWGERGYIRMAMTTDTSGPAAMYRYAFIPPLSFKQNFDSTTLAGIAAGTM